MKFTVRIFILVLNLALAGGTSTASQYSKSFLLSDERSDTNYYNVEIDRDFDTLVDNQSISLPIFCYTSFTQVFCQPISQNTLIQQARAPPQPVYLPDLKLLLFY